jgi:hypothetical protein
MNAWQLWVAAGALFLILEIITPGTFFMWLGAAGFAVAGLVAVFPAMMVVWQVLIFGLLSVLMVFLWRKYRPAQSESNNTLNQGGRDFIGQVYVLIEPIVHGVGRAKVGDSSWRVVGADLPAGSSVRVVAIEGATLRVEAA